MITLKPMGQNINALASAFTSLFLILAVIALLIFHAREGFRIKIADKIAEGECRSVVAHVMNDGRIALNLEEPLKRNDLDRRLNEIFRTRAERVLFISADANVRFQEVADVIDIARRRLDYIAILTPSIERKAGYCLVVPMRPFIDANSSKPKIEMKKTQLWRALWPW